MKKIPTLYKREFSGHKITGIRDEITPGCEAALTDESIATLKLDGACCAIIDFEFYRRFDAKPGRAVPEGAIPCDEPDPVTGHWPHWVKVEADNPSDKWFIAAMNNTLGLSPNATYEAIGPHFQKNPYGLEKDVLVRHGTISVDIKDLSFEGIRRGWNWPPWRALCFGIMECRCARSSAVTLALSGR